MLYYTDGTRHSSGGGPAVPFGKLEWCGLLMPKPQTASSGSR